MKITDRIAIALGALDIGYVAWTIFGTVKIGATAHSMSQNVANVGLPFPDLVVAIVFLVYFLMAACGLALILRRRRLAWLNYVLLPFRLGLVLPTLYPVIALLTAVGMVLPPLATYIVIVVTEIARCVFIYFWQREQSSRSAPGVASAAV
ncbi:hypothetical protein [Dyella sp. S184]|uniref:hypothetical protein n=1 Tax=Dyella sp. S184 TaxID=1641862 RepID=UPI00131C65FF|nr:hypothetical protein [Dyella sp. S184]